MKYGINRDQALDLVRENLHNDNLVKHSLATEAVMQALAEKLGEDQEKWGLAGLLHDLDAEQTESDLAAHTHETVRILKRYGIADDIVEAIRLHNEAAHDDRRRRLSPCPGCRRDDHRPHHGHGFGLSDKNWPASNEIGHQALQGKSFAAGASREIIADVKNWGWNR